ncbi:MAG: histidine kinase N-terminal 7TM domain-containing protein [Dehalococcoidales bacterium]|nr:histidine kinase N-terminal 7TM domain-containing protein [Dehalococcoidales bacterium]
MIISLLVCSSTIVLTWPRRHVPGAAAMLALAAATFIWTLGFYLEANSYTLEGQLFFNNIGYVGSMSVSVAWLVFSLNYTSDYSWMTGRKLILLCVVPLTSLILVWTNEWHHLMWYDAHLATTGSFTVTVKTYGIFFWIALAYNYTLIVTGVFILIRRLFVGIPLYTRQGISLVVAISLPLIWNIIFVFDLLPLPRKDLTPVTFAISGLIIIIGVMRLQLFRAIPFVRELIVQQVSSGVLAFNNDGRLLEANQAALRIFGESKGIIGKPLEQLLSLSPVLKNLRSNVEGGTVQLPLATSGEERLYEMETTPMRDRHDRQLGWLVILRDITEVKRMQEQLVAQDRLASIGEFTAGIAHELNNPLSNIIGFSELLRKREVSSDIKADLDIVSKEAERAARIADNLLIFSRNEQGDKLPIDVNKILRKTLELRAYEQKTNNVQTIFRLSNDLPEVIGDAIQLQQVFLNIIVNAEFFMIEAHGKGTLTIVTEQADEHVKIIFKDDGPGIPQENISRLFNPFFTTKEVGKGTGLGLSICYGIVTGHGGRIWADSKPGEGATFIVELPINK